MNSLKLVFWLSFLAITVAWAQPAASVGTFTTLTETSSSSSVYTFTLTPSLTGYPSGAGQLPQWSWKVGTTCSGGAITGNINGLGAKSIVNQDGANPTATQCASGQRLVLTYDSGAGKLIILAAGTPSSAQTLAGFSGTKDATHCPAGDGTMAICAGSSVGATGTIDFPVGGASQGVTTGIWDETYTGTSYAFGGAGYQMVTLAATGSPKTWANVRLPADLDTTKTVTIYVWTANADGTGGTFNLSATIGCYAGNINITSYTPPTGTATTWALQNMPGTNTGLELTGDIALPAGCTVGSLPTPMMRLTLQRDTTSGTLSSYVGIHGATLFYSRK